MYSSDLVLTGASTFTGDITVNAGILRVGGAGRLAAGTYVGALTVASGATFDFVSSANQIFGTSVSSGNVTNDTTNTLRGAGAYAFGGSGTVTLRGDFSATGTVTVENAVKKVQHQAGGIVGEIRVREGQRVNEGDIVVRLDETMTQIGRAHV